MSVVVLESILKVEKSEWAKELWGNRLLEQYSLEVRFNDESYTFIWVIADSNYGQGVVPEYGDDFEEFLVEICEGRSLKESKKFANSVQEQFSLAMHYVYSNNEDVKVRLPLTVSENNLQSK